MKKLILTMFIALALCMAVTPKMSEANVIEATSLLGASSLEIAVVGAIVGATLYAAIVKYPAGEWGPLGSESIRNCEETHVNGNCYHMKLNKAELGGNTNFANIK